MLLFFPDLPECLIFRILHSTKQDTESYLRACMKLHK